MDDYVILIDRTALSIENPLVRYVGEPLNWENLGKWINDYSFIPAFYIGSYNNTLFFYSSGRELADSKKKILSHCSNGNTLRVKELEEDELPDFLRLEYIRLVEHIHKEKAR